MFYPSIKLSNGMEGEGPKPKFSFLFRLYKYFSSPKNGVFLIEE
jgi:hypothetical protein